MQRVWLHLVAFVLVSVSLFPHARAAAFGGVHAQVLCPFAASTRQGEAKCVEAIGRVAFRMGADPTEPLGIGESLKAYAYVDNYPHRVVDVDGPRASLSFTSCPSLRLSK